MTHKPRVGLNLLHAIPEIGGGWNYIQGIVRALAGVKDLQFVAFATPASAALLPERHSFEVVMTELEARRRALRVFMENTSLFVEAQRRRLDCLHWFANVHGIRNAVPALVTAYDLYPFYDDAVLKPAKRIYVRTMLRRTAASKAVILPISEATAAAWMDRLHVPRSRLAVVRPIIDEKFRPALDGEAEQFRRRMGLPPEFWLYVAHMSPHKNHARLIEAFRRLMRSGFKPLPLVLRGDDDGAHMCSIDTMLGSDMPDHVRRLPRLSAEDLPRLYATATAMIYPSLHEGGAMPVLEAMACGCPVVASSIPVVRESAGDAAILFDPGDVAAIAEAIRTCQKDRGRLERGRVEGLRRAEAYRREAVLPELISAYRRACEKPHS